jgi:hypothetical protein
MMMRFLPISVNSAPKSPSGSSESSRSSLDCNERDEDIRMQCLDALVVCHPSTKFRARGDDNPVGDPVFFVEVELRQKGRHTSRCKDRHRQLRSHRRAKPETGGLATVRAPTHTQFFRWLLLVLSVDPMGLWSRSFFFGPAPPFSQYNPPAASSSSISWGGSTRYFPCRYPPRLIKSTLCLLPSILLTQPPSQVRGVSGILVHSLVRFVYPPVTALAVVYAHVWQVCDVVAHP